MNRPLAVAVAVVVLSTAAAAQDFQVGSRAKAMGGSYTAFGDDPVAIWTNPAGTATQSSQVAITYQSFTEYEFSKFGVEVPADTHGVPKAALLDPPITPSFIGAVVQLGTSEIDMAASIAYVRPFQIKYVYVFQDPVLNTLFEETNQQFSRIRVAYAAGLKTSDGAWFNRVSVGVALDYVYTQYHEVDQSPIASSGTLVWDDDESALGYGLGLLASAYDGDSFRVDVGAAYNSSAKFPFELDPNVFPVWNWPALASGGLAFYIGRGYPLRITMDIQWIGWEHAVGSPQPGARGFRNTTSYALGAEYGFKVADTKRLYARAGLKSFETPWGNKDDQPSVGESQLAIKTKGSRLEILTLGAGFYWTRKNADGETRLSGIDVAAELFGETRLLIGIGFNYQFD
jgi:hypothetical protein